MWGWGGSVELIPGHADVTEVGSTVDVALRESAEVFKGVDFVGREQARVSFEDLLLDGVVDYDLAFEFRMFVEECLLVLMVGCTADRIR